MPQIFSQCSFVSTWFGLDVVGYELSFCIQSNETPPKPATNDETMDELFWIIKGQLAGRVGPNTEPWDLAALRAGGIGAIISVNNGEHCVREDIEAHDIAYACIPFSSNAPALPGDDDISMAAARQAYEFATAQIADGRGVLVHCSAGKDRTGLLLSYFVMQHAGLSPRDAIDRVRETRPIALSAEGWDEFAEHVLTRLSTE
jgi:hypothetical protein